MHAIRLLLSITLTVFGLPSILLAGSDLNIKIISTEECVFGDADLIIRDLSKDLSFHYLDTKLLIEVREEKTQKLLLNEVLADLSQPDGTKDRISEVFKPEGLALHIKDVEDSIYTISICKVGESEVTSCQSLKPQSFDELMKEHKSTKLDNARYNKLYYFKKFAFEKGKFNANVSFEDERALAKSMDLELKNGLLLVKLPQNSPNKCSSPKMRNN